MNGSALRAVYIMGPAGNAASDPSGTQMGLDYTSGPLMVGVSQANYEDYADNGGAVGTAGSESKMTTLRGSYDMGMATVKVGRWTIEQSGLAGATTGFEVEGSVNLCWHASWWRIVVGSVFKSR